MIRFKRQDTLGKRLEAQPIDRSSPRGMEMDFTSEALQQYYLDWLHTGKVFVAVCHYLLTMAIPFQLRRLRYEGS